MSNWFRLDLPEVASDFEDLLISGICSGREFSFPKAECSGCKGELDVWASLPLTITSPIPDELHPNLRGHVLEWTQFDLLRKSLSADTGVAELETFPPGGDFGRLVVERIGPYMPPLFSFNVMGETALCVAAGLGEELRGRFDLSLIEVSFRKLVESPWKPGGTLDGDMEEPESLILEGAHSRSLESQIRAFEIDVTHYLEGPPGRHWGKCEECGNPIDASYYESVNWVRSLEEAIRIAETDRGRIFEYEGEIVFDEEVSSVLVRHLGSGGRVIAL